MPEPVAVLLPVHQPDARMADRVRALAAESDFRILVVDDGSGAEFDAVFAALPENVVVVRMPTHEGKGIAIKAGLRYVTANWPDVAGVVAAESHGGHTAANIRAVADALGERGDAVLLGSRVYSRPLPKRSQLGNWLVRLAFSGACSVKLRDTQTDLRGYPSAILPSLAEVGGERYEYQTNVLLWAAGEGIEIVEVPLPDPYDDVSIPKHFHPVRDSVRIFRRIFKFALASFSGFCIDYVTVLLLRSATAPVLPESLSLFVSVFAGRALSGVTSFTINRKMGFHVIGSFWRSTVKYFMILFFIMATNYWLLYVTHLIIQIPLWIAKILVETAMFFVNYALQTRLVFNPKKKRKSAEGAQE